MNMRLELYINVKKGRPEKLNTIESTFYCQEYLREHSASRAISLKVTKFKNGEVVAFIYDNEMCAEEMSYEQALEVIGSWYVNAALLSGHQIVISMGYQKPWRHTEGYKERMYNRGLAV